MAVIDTSSLTLVATATTLGEYDNAGIAFWNGQPLSGSNHPTAQEDQLSATWNFYVDPKAPNTLYIVVSEVVDSNFFLISGTPFDLVALTGFQFSLKVPTSSYASFSNQFAVPTEALVGSGNSTPLQTTPGWTLLGVSGAPDQAVYQIGTPTVSDAFTHYTVNTNDIRISGGGVFQFTFDPSVNLLQANFNTLVATATNGEGAYTEVGTLQLLPSVTSITAHTDNGANDLNAGHVVTISLGFNEPVFIGNAPSLLLNDYEVANYTSGSGTNGLTFTYTVQSGDNISDLQVIGFDGTVHDSAGVSLTGLVQDDLEIQIDTTPPAPLMSDAIENSHKGLTMLSGVSEADSKVLIFDGTKPLGTVTADSSGNWTLQANISGGTHQFTETAADLAGNTGTSTGVTIYAPTGHQTLAGGNGNDFLIGGPNDTLIGGVGNDTFVCNQGFGKETVADFNPNQDQLAFDHALFTQSTAAGVLSHAHDTRFGAEIVLDPHDAVTLTGVTVAQLQAAQTAHLNWVHFF